ncbi:unnamed protein product, partial [marine sediment metagenome]
MTQIGEMVGFDTLAKEFKAKCPFDEDIKGGPKTLEEDCKDDDLDSVQELQKNDGGTLGKNLSAGIAGKADGGPFPPNDYIVRDKPFDTARGAGSPKIWLNRYKDTKEGDFPFTVAAHHLLPGNAAGLTPQSTNREVTKIFNY